MGEQTSLQQSTETNELNQNSQIDSGAKEDHPLSIADAKSLVEIVHREIHYEHGLISHRMSWYVTSQSFLMAAFAVVGGYSHNFVWLAKWFIPPLGILISIVTLISISAAIMVMSRLRKEETGLIDDHRLQSPFKLLRKKTHRMGLLPPVSVPPLFLVVWILIWIRIHLN